MKKDTQRFEQPQQLRQFINLTLSQQDRLEADHFPMSETLLMRGEQLWGVLFCLHGPRSTRLTAVWDVANQVVLFYGSSGQQFQKTSLRCADRFTLSHWQET